MDASLSCTTYPSTLPSVSSYPTALLHTTAMVDFYTLKAEKPKGETYDFSSLKGKVVLIVNT